eukprot:2023660-Rhodomonas_salina.1
MGERGDEGEGGAERVEGSFDGEGGGEANQRHAPMTVSVDHRRVAIIADCIGFHRVFDFAAHDFRGRAGIR